jgi:hypothetical protein
MYRQVRRGQAAPDAGGVCMEERFGFIHEKLDIKLLILYVLRKLPDKVSFTELIELVMIDGGFDYFEYVQCLTELEETGHVEHIGDCFQITEKGIDHCDAVSSSLPFSVRRLADEVIEPILERMRRDALIGTKHENLPGGVCMVTLSLSDGVGDIVKLSLLTDGETQAASMEKYFRANAEPLYHKLIALLTPEN